LAGLDFSNGSALGEHAEGDRVGFPDSRMTWKGGDVNKKRAIPVVGTAIAIAVAGGIAIANESDQPITGADYQKAAAAALAFTGGGTVSDTEQGDEESYYEVEVTRADGTQVDVQLDTSFNVVGSEEDGQGEDEGKNDD